MLQNNEYLEKHFAGTDFVVVVVICQDLHKATKFFISEATYQGYLQSCNLLRQRWELVEKAEKLSKVAGIPPIS